MVIIIYNNHNGKCHLEMDDGGYPHDLGNLHTTVGDNNNDDNNDNNNNYYYYYIAIIL